MLINESDEFQHDVQFATPVNVYSRGECAFSKQTLEKLASYYWALTQISAKFSTNKRNDFTFI